MSAGRMVAPTGFGLRRAPVMGLLTAVAVLVVVELLSRAEVIDPHAVPPVSDVGRQLAGFMGDGTYWADVGSTLWVWTIGMLLTLLIAIPVGLLLGSLTWLYEWVRTAIEFLRPIPPVALIPLAVLIFGPTPSMQVFLICVAAVWPLLFQTIYGVRDVDSVLVETAHAYRLPAMFRARFIILPSTLPYIATGLRISATIGLIVAIAASLVSGAAGLGAAIRLAQSAAAPTRAWALIVTVGVLGVLVNSGFKVLERRALHWHVSQRLGSNL